MLSAAMPVVCFLVIIVLILLVVFHAIAKINISNKMARKIELVGYGLLVSFIVWQFFIKSILMGDFYDIDLFIIKQQLQSIHYYLLEITEQASVNFDAIDMPFSSAFENNFEYVRIQMKCVDIIEGLLTVISTICIAIGRFYELGKRDD